MGLINIPAYAYIDGTTRYTVCQIIADDNAYNTLINKWTDAGKPSTWTQSLAVWRDSVFSSSEIFKFANDYLNAFIFSDKLKLYLPNTLPAGTDITDLISDLALIGIMPEIFTSSVNYATRLVTLDNVELIDSNYEFGSITYNSLTHEASCSAGNYSSGSISANGDTGAAHIYLLIYPSDIITGNAIDGGAYQDGTDPVFLLDYWLVTGEGGITYANLSAHVQLSLHYFDSLKAKFQGVNVNTPGTTTDDLDNPYGYEGSSGPGGGNGKYGDIDAIEATEVPDLPTINAASLGLITLYNPTASVINSLAQFLWSGMFDPTSFKKLFADPMGCLIGLSIVPAIPSTGGSKNIKFGSVDTGINCSYLSSNYCNVDCGSLSVDEYVGSFLDYDPYCKISIYLPYCGFHTLSADDLVGGSINVQYNIDVLSGNCIAFIAHSEKGVLYSFSGTCLTNVPLTGQSFSGALQAYYTGLAGVAGSALGALGTGGAGLVATAGNAASAAMNTMFNSKPDFQRSGSTGGAAGIMGVQTPFLVIERPRYSVPNQVERYVGQTSNITMYLGNCKGFTMVEYVHIHNVTGTSEEVKEIEALLKEGVIL